MDPRETYYYVLYFTPDYVLMRGSDGDVHCPVCTKRADLPSLTCTRCCRARVHVSPHECTMSMCVNCSEEVYLGP